MATLSVYNNLVTVSLCFNDYVLDMDRETYKILSNNDGKPDQNKMSETDISNVWNHKTCTKYDTVRYSSALSNCGQYYTSVTENKQLLLWDTISWTLISTRNFSKTVSKVLFSPSGNSILVADKTGDVYSYSVKEPAEEGKLLLGHVSLLLDFIVTPDEKFIITCDRDEKIRVSHYPNAYNIRCFCLGHTSFVSKLSLLDDSTLISASGDGTIRLWNYSNGEELSSHFIGQDIKEEVCKRSSLVETKVENYPIINLSSIYKSKKISIFCVSIYKCAIIMVYSVSKNSHISISFLNKINLLSEPYAFSLTANGTLWILGSSDTEKDTPALKALTWDNTESHFVTLKFEKMQRGMKLLNELLSLNCRGYVNDSIAGLHKNLPFENSKYKKIKL